MMEPKMTTEQLCQLAVKHGMALDLVPKADLGILKQYRVRMTTVLPDIVGKPPFFVSYNNRGQWDEAATSHRDAIETAANVGDGCAVILFNGKDTGEGEDVQKKNLVEGLTTGIGSKKSIVKFARDANVRLVLELLNDQNIEGHAMKGHPGILGSNLDFCLEVVEQADPSGKVLGMVLDFYHLYVKGIRAEEAVRRAGNRFMTGHIAGYNQTVNRSELHLPGQEILLPPLRKLLQDANFNGPMVFEWIPTQTTPPEVDSSISKSMSSLTN